MNSARRPPTIRKTRQVSASLSSAKSALVAAFWSTAVRIVSVTASAWTLSIPAFSRALAAASVSKDIEGIVAETGRIPAGRS